MATEVKRRRGSTTQHDSFTGAEGELTVDTTKNTVVVHNAAKEGGFPLLREDFSNAVFTTPDARYLLETNNLSDLTNTSTARTNLGVAIGSDVQAYDAQLDTLSGLSAEQAADLLAITASEYTQLQNIDSTTISSTQWGYLGELNQSLTTTSDVSFNTVTADLTGNVTGDVTGDLTGAIHVQGKNETGGTLTKGTPVYISGQVANGQQFTIGVADSDGSGTMPSIGILSADVNDNAMGDIVTHGKLIGIDTSSFTVGDELYISSSGTLTATPPTGESNLLQKIAKVIRVDSTDGQIYIMGAGRTNAVPNLDQGAVFIGDSNNQAVASTFSIVNEPSPSGGGSLAYSNGTFTFTPANVSDLTGYIETISTSATSGLSSNESNGTVTMSLDVNALTAETTVASGDFLALSQSGNTKKVALSNIDLSLLDNSTSGFIDDYTVTQADVTAHQAALTISESQISPALNYDNYDYWTLTVGADSSNISSNDAVTFIAGNNVTLSKSGTSITINSSLPAGAIDTISTSNTSGLSSSESSGDVTLNLALGNLAVATTADASADSVAILEGANTKKILLSNLPLISDDDFSSNGLMKRTGAGTYGVVTDNSSNWDTAYGWGDHSTEGYLTAHPTIGGNATNQSNSGTTVIQSLTFDSNGHVLSVGSTTLNQVTDTNDYIASVSFDTSAFTFSANYNTGSSIPNIQSVSWSHNHDDRYYTETEVGNFFNGTTSISGYNKSNWDTAFNWGNHASAGYLTAVPSQFLTETEGDARYLKLSGGTLTGSLTVNAVVAQSNDQPRIQLKETNATADENVELMLNGGDFFIRTLNDDGTNPANENLFKVNHEGVVTLMAQGTTTATNLNALFQDSNGVLKRRTLGSNAFNSTAFLTSSSFTVADDDTNTTNIATNDSLTISGGTGIDVAVTSGTVTITSTVTDTDTNTFVNAASFNTSDGVLTLTKNNSSTITADLDGRYLTLGGGTLTGDLFVPEYIKHTGDSDTYIRFQPNDLNFTAGGQNLVRADYNSGGQSQVVINETGIDADFRVESDSNANAFFVEGSSGNVGIGTTSPAEKLDVHGNVQVGGQSVTSSTTNHETVLRVKGKNNYSNGTTWYGDYGQIILHSNNNMTGSSRRFMITNALGNNKFAIVRSTDANTDPVVNSTNSGSTPNSGTADFVIDNTGNVGIGTTSPAFELDVEGTVQANNLKLQNLSTGSSDTTVLTLDQGQNVNVRTLGSNAFDSTSYLPITGGTLTGNLKLQNTTSTSLSKIDLEESSTQFFRLHHLNSGFTTSGTNIAGSALMVAGSGSTGGMVLRTDADAPIIFATNGLSNERMRIKGDGNVGIGETNPSNKLEVNSGSTQTVSIFKASSTSTTANNGGALIGIRNTNNTNGNMEGLFFQNSNGTGTSGIIGYNVNHSTNEGLMTFGVRNSSGTFGEKMRIDSSGNVGIGTDSPDTLLHLEGSVSSGTALLTIHNISNSNGAKIAFNDTSGGTQTGALTYRHSDSLSQGGGASFHFTGEPDTVLVVGNDSNSGRIAVDRNGAAEVAYGFRGDVNTGMYSSVADTLNFATGGSERLRIDSSGDLTMKGGRIIVRESDDGNDAVKITRDADEGYVQLFNSGTQTIELRGNGDSYFNSGNVGIGTTSPDGKLHVYTGDAGAITTNANHDDLIIESSANVGINLFSPNTSYQYLAFGDPDGSNSGYVRYYHGTNQMVLRAGGADTVYINSGNVGIGTNSPDTLLHLSSASSPQLRIQDTTNNVKLSLYTQDSNAFIGTNSSHNLNIGTANTTAINIDNSQDVTVNNDLQVDGITDTTRLIRSHDRKSSGNADPSERYPIGHHTLGEEVFSIDPTWSQDEIRTFFNSNNIEWLEDSDAPSGYAIKISGSVNVGGQYGSGFPYIPVYDGDVFYMEYYIKTPDTNTGIARVYVGSNEYNRLFNSLGGNPGSFGYWVNSGTTFSPNTGWTKNSGYIKNTGGSNVVGEFESGIKYWTPMALWNYQTGSQDIYISGWRVIRVRQDGNRFFSGNVGIGTGTTTPSRQLHVNGGSNIAARFETTADSIIELVSTNSWAGINFNDSGSVNENIWFNGGHGTFAIGGGGSNVSGKKLHIDGGVSIGNSADALSVPVSGLYVQGMVGIGTNDPDGQGYSYAEDLVILGGNSASNGVGITLRSDGQRYGVIAFGDDADDNVGEIYYDHTNNNFNFRTNTTVGMRLQPDNDLEVYGDLEVDGDAIIDGNVGIGIDNPSSRLSIKSTGSTEEQITVQQSGNTNTIVAIGQSDNGNSCGAIQLNNINGAIGTNLVGHGASYFNNGNVGIGTTSPNEKLDVSGSVRIGNLKIQNAYSGRIGFNRNTATGTIYDSNYGAYQLQHNNVGYLELQSYNSSGAFQSRLVFTTAGNLGIGTTSPSEKLEVTGNAILDASNANLKIKAGVTGTKGDIQWTFNTDSTVYASAGIEYDNRGTDGFLIDSGYPITMDFASSYIRWRYNGSEKMRLNSSGNVGIGTTSPGSILHAKDANPFLTIENTTAGSSASPSYGGILFVQSNGTSTGASIQSGDQLNSNSNNDLIFTTRATGGGSHTEKLRILGGGGITFNGDTATANALDDYEEGTFTPSIHAGASSPSYHSNNYGKYTKIGNVVHCSGRFQVTSIQEGSSSTNVELGGFPFSCSVGLGNGTGAVAGSIGYASGFDGESPTMIQIRNNENNAFLYYQNSSLGISNLKGNDFTGSGAHTIVFQITYQTN